MMKTTIALLCLCILGAVMHVQATDYPPEFSKFEIVNAKTGNWITTISNDVVYDLHDYREFNIKAVPKDRPAKNVESGIFWLNDKEFRTENVAPYFLCGDYRGDIYGCDGRDLRCGIKHKLTAIPYSEDDGRGTKGTPLTVWFTIKCPRKRLA